MKAIYYNLLAWSILPFMDTIAKYLSSDLSFFKSHGQDTFLLFFLLYLACFFSLEKI
jgi:hypothetical protein